MAGTPSRYATLALCVVLVLATMLPTTSVETKFAVGNAKPMVPASLDRFLVTVRRVTSWRSGILVAVADGNILAANLIYFRAAYLLYPRRIYRIFTQPYVRTRHGRISKPLAWHIFQFFCRQVRVRYALVWGVRIAAPAGAILVQRDGGMLVQVRP